MKHAPLTAIALSAALNSAAMAQNSLPNFSIIVPNFREAHEIACDESVKRNDFNHLKTEQREFEYRLSMLGCEMMKEDIGYENYANSETRKFQKYLISAFLAHDIESVVDEDGNMGPDTAGGIIQLSYALGYKKLFDNSILTSTAIGDLHLNRVAIEVRKFQNEDFELAKEWANAPLPEFNITPPPMQHQDLPQFTFPYPETSRPPSRPATPKFVPPPKTMPHCNDVSLNNFFNGECYRDASSSIAPAPKTATYRPQTFST
jgi:hypothetical protein